MLYVNLLFFIVVQVQLSPFSPHHYLPPHPSPPPNLSPTPRLALSMGPFYIFIDDSPPFSPIIPSPTLWLLSVCSLCQCLCLYFACLFVVGSI